MTYRSPKFLEAMDAYDEGRLKDALRLMEECAQQGDPVACFTAALWYRNRECDFVDLERSGKWLAQLEELAEQGNVEAQWEMAQNHRFANLLPLSIERANYWLERAAKGGYGEAQHHLAWYFESGQYDYPVDPDSAQKWYQQAFDRDHPETLYLFAVRLFREGQPTDEAIRLLRKAAAEGFRQAEHMLRHHTH